MATLDDLRKQIDQLDDEIMKLLDKRYNLTTEIGSVKARTNIEILDTSREQLILDKTSQFSHSPQLKEIYKTIMKESKSLQRK